MKKITQWIRRQWEQRQAPEPSPHPDVGRLELARVRALLCLGLAACGTANAGSPDAAVKADVIQVAPRAPTKARKTPQSGTAPLGRPSQSPPKRTDKPYPLTPPFEDRLVLPTHVRRF